MRIDCTIEWISYEAGWRAVAEFGGKTYHVTQAQNFASARRRLKNALEADGATAELAVRARIPRTIEAELSRYRELAALLLRLQKEHDGLKLSLAKKLCNQLHFSEREAAAWLGVSGAHISAKLRAHQVDAIDTGEFPRPSRDDENSAEREHDADDGEPARVAKHGE